MKTPDESQKTVIKCQNKKQTNRNNICSEIILCDLNLKSGDEAVRLQVDFLNKSYK